MLWASTAVVDATLGLGMMSPARFIASRRRIGRETDGTVNSGLSHEWTYERSLVKALPNRA